MPTDTKDIDSIVTAIRNLQLAHQQEQLDLLVRQQQELDSVLTSLPVPPLSPRSASPPPTAPIPAVVLPPPSSPSAPIQHISNNKYPLQVGSPVTIRSSGKRGKPGDKATVTSLSDTSQFVGLKLLPSGPTAQRHAKNLDLDLRK